MNISPRPPARHKVSSTEVGARLIKFPASFTLQIPNQCYFWIRERDRMLSYPGNGAKRTGNARSGAGGGGGV